MPSLFALPNELILASINTQFPCREQQVRSLATLLAIRSAPCRNIVVHGLEAVGKTAVVQAVLNAISDGQGADAERDGIGPDADSLRHAFVKCAECISGRQLLEKLTLAAAVATGYRGTLGRCENLAQLAVEMGMLLEWWTEAGRRKKRLVLVIDGIDKQKDAPHTLIPAVARLGESIPGVTTIFLVTAPPPHFLHFYGVPHIHFPAYTKTELLQILALDKPVPLLPSGDKDTQDTWSRFGAIVWDTLSKYSGSDIISFRIVCNRLWPRFIKPILDGQLSPAPFSKLVLANRSLLQDESTLLPYYAVDSTASIEQAPTTPSKIAHKVTSQSLSHPLTNQLPITTRLLLIASYLCSHNPPKTDITYFCKSLSINKRRKRGGGTALTSSRPGITKHRKISRKLLGPQAFVLERMLAVFHFLRVEAGLGRGKGKRDDSAGSADLLTAVSTLVALRLVNRIGGVGLDVLDGGSRYRVNVGWDVVRSLGRSVGIEVEDFVAE